jgi:hypothetical protein
MKVLRRNSKNYKDYLFLQGMLKREMTPYLSEETIQMTLDFSSETKELGQKWDNIFQLLRQKLSSPNPMP